MTHHQQDSSYGTSSDDKIVKPQEQPTNTTDSKGCCPACQAKLCTRARRQLRDEARNNQS